MKKVILVLLICSMSLVLSACKSHDDSVERETVSDFTVATIEYIEDSGYKLITSEIGKLHTFDSLNLKESESAFEGDWVYRIVFNPKAYTKNAEEFVILFGEHNISINGKTYEGDGFPYSELLNWVSAKYQYFDYELICE